MLHQIIMCEFCLQEVQFLENIVNLGYPGQPYEELGNDVQGGLKESLQRSEISWHNKGSFMIFIQDCSSIDTFKKEECHFLLEFE